MKCPDRQHLLDAAHGRAGNSPVESHVRACADCRKAYEEFVTLAGHLARLGGTHPCPPDETLAAWARKPGSPDATRHLAGCPSCRQAVADLTDALSTEPGAPPSERLRRKVLSLVPPAAPLRGLTARRHRWRMLRPERRNARGWVAAAAVFLLGAVAIFMTSGPREVPSRRGAPAGPVAAETPPAPKLMRPEPAPPPREEAARPEPTAVPAPLRPASEPVPPAPPSPPLPPPPAPRPPEEPPAPPPAAGTPRPSAPTPPTETEIRPAPARRPVALALAAGSALRAHGNAVEPLEREATFDPGDEVRTGRRRPALLRAAGDIDLALDRSSAARVEERPDGEWRLTLLRGAVLLKVRPRPGPVVVATSHGEARVTGTSFVVSLDARRMTLSVLEGAVRLRGEKGEALVEAGRRSSVRAGERPTPPARADVEADATWHRTLDLAVRRDAEPYIDHEPGSNAHLAGVVVSTPYSRSETDAGRLGRALAEFLDVGLVSGHFHRDRARRVWFNVDRGTEGEFRADGTLGPARVTDRARKVTSEYLSLMRAAAGVSPGRPVSLVVTLREHSEATPGGEELEICEVAWTGWNPATIRRLKALYAQLLEKHRPAYRVEMKFEDLDDPYEYRGQRRAFKFTESDAEADGYMARRYAQAAITFFFNPGFGRQPEDFDAYARILGEMVEFLYAPR